VNCVELFAGAGGAALGLEAAGISHLACIEYDADACATLRAAGLPCVEGDVREPDLYLPEWVGCDLLWASFPCQAWSTAGKREGAKDERNGWPWTVDAIDCLEPEWFAAENVTGLLTHRGGCASRCLGPDECPRAYFDLVILEQLRERFAWVGFRVLNASSFGVPQHRRRVIIVAGPHAIDWPEPTHGKPSGQDDLFGRKLKPWATIRGTLGLRGSLSSGRNTEANPRQERPIRTEEPCFAVSGQGNHYLEWRGVRRLTVEECATLQGFPVGHAFHGTKGSQSRQVGNAVPPTLARVVGEAIKKSRRP
jgi:DNA (cytosine-5)-methyltransferase 1